VLIAIATALLVGFAVLQLSSVFGASRGRVDRSLALITAYGFNEEQQVALPADKPRESIASKLGGRFIKNVGTATLQEQRRMLLAAGHYTVTPEQFLGFRILGAIGVPVLITQFALSSLSLGMAIPAELLGCAVGWTLPSTIVARRGKTRLGQIDRGMPELVDLLVVGVESGMGFNAAIRAAAERVHGPLAGELKLLLQEQQLGASLQDGLKHVVERADTPAVRAFVRTIAQADKLGISIGSMMRTLADEMRKRRRASAEEQAQKAPVKILFPLVFLIFPSIFVVLLAPAGIQIAGGFS